MLAHWLDTAAQDYPNDTAVITDGHILNYSELSALARNGAQHLSTQGARPGDVIAVATHSPVRLAQMAWSVSALGGTLLPFNPAIQPDTMHLLMERAGARWYVADDNVAWSGTRLTVPDWDDSITVGQSCNPDSHAVALIVPTSGSEGESKGVMLSHANLQAAVSASRSRIPLQSGDVWLACLPLYHIGGMSILYRCAEAGAAVLLLPTKFAARPVWQMLQQYPVTHISLVPAMLAQLLDYGVTPSSLKHALIGGAALSAELAQRAKQQRWPLCVSYGLSEAASQVATLCNLRKDWGPGMVGQPLPDMQVRIVDETGQACSGVGRICLRGPMVMHGYVAASGDGSEGMRDGWFATGDSGHLDAQGNLVVLGRCDDMLVTGGENVHPLQVETHMLSCPGVQDVALTAVPDSVWGDRLVALLVGDATFEAVNDWCRQNLPSHQRPRVLLRVAALPRNAMGKLQRARLRELACATMDNKCYSVSD